MSLRVCSTRLISLPLWIVKEHLTETSPYCLLNRLTVPSQLYALSKGGPPRVDLSTCAVTQARLTLRGKLIHWNWTQGFWEGKRRGQPSWRQWKCGHFRSLETGVHRRKWQVGTQPHTLTLSHCGGLWRMPGREGEARGCGVCTKCFNKQCKRALLEEKALKPRRPW